MEVKDLNYFKELFSNLLLQSPEEELAEGQTNGDSADLATVDRENSLSLKLNGRKALYLRKVTKALEKIKEGSFGTCEECDSDIGRARLLARPTATMCIHCKEEQERGESHILYSKKSNSQGKGFKEPVLIPGGKDETEVFRKKTGVKFKQAAHL